MDIFAEADAPVAFVEQLAGQPFLVSLLLVGTLLFALYTLLERLGVKALQRILVVIPILLMLSIFYFQHGPLMATVLLSAGFILSFIVAFLQLGGKQ